MITDLTGTPVTEGMFICYATKTEAPSLQFGRVEKIVDKREISPRDGELRGEQVITVAHCDYRGNPVNKTRFAVNPETDRYETMDTGKQQTSTLRQYGEKSNRLLITQPRI